ncbi:unnamed protein product [Lactuca saligna]|uniref:Uncharacterized protein n=1 Tax=Lactuca saligna TaxID=75948 RepID=A0AA35VAN3_LACSI|nr:unnamed protein product [Lactuca saligna]
MNSTSQNHAPTACSQDVGGSGSNQQNNDSVDQQDGTNIIDTVFDEDGDEVVGSKRATRSPTWQHFIKFKLNDEVKARSTCSEETEAYCPSVEFDYDVEEENTKESGTTSLDDFA